VAHAASKRYFKSQPRRSAWFSQAIQNRTRRAVSTGSGTLSKRRWAAETAAVYVDYAARQRAINTELTRI